MVGWREESQCNHSTAREPSPSKLPSSRTCNATNAGDHSQFGEVEAAAFTAALVASSDLIESSDEILRVVARDASSEYDDDVDDAAARRSLAAPRRALLLLSNGTNATKNATKNATNATSAPVALATAAVNVTPTVYTHVNYTLGVELVEGHLYEGMLLLRCFFDRTLVPLSNFMLPNP